MADYTKTYDGAAKDTAESIVTGADFDVEFSAIETAIGTKADKAVPATANNLAGLDVNGNLQDTAIELLSNTITVDLKGNVKAANGTQVLNAGTDGTDATFTGDVTGDLTGNVTGNADSATILATGRTFSLTGNATGTSAAFNGSGNVSIPVTLAANSVQFSNEIENGTTEGAVAVPPFTISSPISTQGVLSLSCIPGNSGGVFVEIYTGATNGWVRYNQIGLYTNQNAQLISDGTNVRINNITASTHTVRWEQCFK